MGGVIHSDCPNGCLTVMERAPHKPEYCPKCGYLMSLEYQGWMYVDGRYVRPDNWRDVDFPLTKLKEFAGREITIKNYHIAEIRPAKPPETRKLKLRRKKKLTLLLVEIDGETGVLYTFSKFVRSEVKELDLPFKVRVKHSHPSISLEKLNKEE